MSAENGALLADEVLTWIEGREADQTAYGLYDVTHTGADVLAGFRGADGAPAPAERDAALRGVLRALVDSCDLIRLDAGADGGAADGEDDPADWVVRSRVAETVRLLTKLRQRIVREDARKARHRIDDGRRLVEDVKFAVAARRVPRRDLPAGAALAPLAASSAEGAVVAELLATVVERALPKLRLLSGFQRRTLEAVLAAVELDAPRAAERGVVVTAGTGSGKTYAFFLPTLAKIVLERCLRGRVGVKAVCIYPRVALSENQLADFIEVLFHLNALLAERDLPPVTIGLESGATFYELPDLSRTDERAQRAAAKRGWRFIADPSGYLSPFARCVGTAGAACAGRPEPLLARAADPGALVCPACGVAYPFIAYARDRMAAHPPDLLIATTESLHARLGSSAHQHLFGTQQFCAPSVVMLDEIHLQTSTAGTQVALLLRRLLARIRQGRRDRRETDNLAFVGLSATIAQPVQFLAELTGLPVTRVGEVTPEDDELETVGAERFVFVRAEDAEDTAVLSTLIQTAMCVLHTMPQPGPDSPLPRYRAFGFVQSLDLVGRWLNQMQDAEKVRPEQVRARGRQNGGRMEARPIRTVPLYAYRFPPYNRRIFPELFGPGTPTGCGCEHRPGPDPACPYFRSGECWWVLSRRGRALQTPLAIKRRSGDDRAVAIGPDDDLVITTSALEVGYDDEQLMCVLQYTAPANVASFVQRKGRGGRKVGTRPIVVTVLSPYKPTDLFLFRNHHLLTDPSFRKLPLNHQNRYLQRIHGFHALTDWLAYRAHRAGVGLDLRRLDREGWAFLRAETADPDVLLAFKDYVRETLGVTDGRVLADVVSAEPDGFLWRIFAKGLMQGAHQALAVRGQEWLDGRDALRPHIPENLFSDINLPEVLVDYRPEDPAPGRRPSAESIGLALGETMPGNVTFRGGGGASWVPPRFDPAGAPLVALADFYDWEARPVSVDTVNLPGRALRLVDLDPSELRELPVYRPTAIRPRPFGDGFDASYWRCDPDTGELREARDPATAPQGTRAVAASSSAHGLGAVQLVPERVKPTPAFVLGPDHPALAGDPLARAVADRIVLYSAEAANQNLLKVHRIVLGSQYTLVLDGGADEVRGVVGFGADGGDRCALGFEMRTEGVLFEVPADPLAGLAPSRTTRARRRRDGLRHAFVTELTVEHGVGYFAADNLAAVLATVADGWAGAAADAGAGAPADLGDWFAPEDPEFRRRFADALGGVHQLSPRKAAGVRALVEGEAGAGAGAGYLARYRALWADAVGDGPVARRTLRDSVRLSLAQALKQTAQEVAGVEGLNYVAAWTELGADYAERAADAVWLYEIGMGGIGVMRATQALLRTEPDRFWSVLAEKLTDCPTAGEETLLRRLLAQPDAWLEAAEVLVLAVAAAPGAAERRRALDRLLAAVRRQLGVVVRQEEVKGLFRVFLADEELRPAVGGERLVNWRLMREINRDFLPACAAGFGREPTFVEARAGLYRAVAGAPAGAPPPYPQLALLLRLFREAYGAAGPAGPAGAAGAAGAAEPEVRRAFEAAVERRLLLSCRGACPACLADRSGDIEAPGLAGLLLDRALLAEWLDHLRAGHRVGVAAGEGGAAEVARALAEVFAAGRATAYLRAPAGEVAALCATVSYLTDAGVDTALGMVYPMVTGVRTVYPPDGDDEPRVELALRAIG